MCQYGVPSSRVVQQPTAILVSFLGLRISEHTYNESTTLLQPLVKRNYLACPSLGIVLVRLGDGSRQR